MADRQRRRPRDPLALAKLIADIATGQTPDTEPDDRNPAAVALGKLGGAKGGDGAEERTSPKRRDNLRYR